MEVVLEQVRNLPLNHPGDALCANRHGSNSDCWTKKAADATGALCLRRSRYTASVRFVSMIS